MNVATLKSKIAKLPPDTADSTICWSCKRACTCSLRHTVGHATENGIKVTSCTRYERDSIKVYEYVKVTNTSMKTFHRHKEKIKRLLGEAGYKLDYTPKEE